jgi:hypothetical protein
MLSLTMAWCIAAWSADERADALELELVVEMVVAMDDDDDDDDEDDDDVVKDLDRENNLVSTSSGTDIPSHLMNCSVFSRPQGANVRIIFFGVIPALRHKSA